MAPFGSRRAGPSRFKEYPVPKWNYRVRVRLVRERAERFGPTITCAGDIAALLTPELASLDREHFVALHLDVKNRLISRETVSIGHLSAALVHPREVWKAALLANAASVAFVHNHPSGSTEPSREDLELTRRLYKAGEILGVPVLDHVVVSTSGFVSLAERGTW
jgi:DNA repair protein RadC